MKRTTGNRLGTLAVATAIAALPATVLAQDYTHLGPYFGIEGGVNWLNHHDVTVPGLIIPGNRAATLNFKTGYIGGLTLGYTYQNGFRPELELDYRRNSIRSIFAGGASLANPSGRGEAYTAMTNLWYDIPMFGGSLLSHIHPYLGGGVGFARIGLRHIGAGGFADVVSGYDSAFAYQGGAGIGIDIAPHLTASFDWRYLQTNHVNYPVAGSPNDGRFRYRSQSAMFSLRYALGAEPPALPPPPPPAPATPPPPPQAAQVTCPPAPPGFQVDQNGCVVEQKHVVLRGVNFKYNKSTLTDPAKHTLDGVAKVLIGPPALDAKIVGYTDSQGSAAYNQKLSQQRANSVRSYLIGQGVPASQLSAEGKGEADPIASNKTLSGRAQNRRVEINLTKVPAHVKVTNAAPTAASVNAATSKHPLPPIHTK